MYYTTTTMLAFVLTLATIYAVRHPGPSTRPVPRPPIHYCVNC